MDLKEINFLQSRVKLCRIPFLNRDFLSKFDKHVYKYSTWYCCCTLYSVMYMQRTSVSQLRCMSLSL